MIRARRNPIGAWLVAIVCALATGTTLRALDCNRNGRHDALDLAHGYSFDCNRNGIPDECDESEAFADGTRLDCNRNGIEDWCDIAPRFRFGREEEMFHFGFSPTDLVAVDLDGEAGEELIGLGNGRIVVLGFDAAGRVVRRGEYPDCGGNSRLATGDVNGDGRTDLVTYRLPYGDAEEAPEAGNLGVRFGRADGFSDCVSVAVPGGPESLTIADADADGIQDVCCGTRSGTIEILWGAGDDGGGEAFTVRSTIETTYAATALFVEDFDRDGFPDLLVGERELKEDRFRLFASRVDVRWGDASRSFEERTLFSARTGLGGLAVADLNGDARLDVALVQSNTALRFLEPRTSLYSFLNEGDRIFRLLPPLDVWMTHDDRLLRIPRADRDGDEVLYHSLHPDIGRRPNDSGRLYRFSWRSGELHRSEPIGTAKPLLASAVFDVDRDGDPDIVYSDGDRTHVLRANEGLGASALFGWYERIQGHLTLPTGVASRDWDGDGHLDLAAGVDVQTYIRFLWGGADDLGAATTVELEHESRKLNPVDFDRDGDLDIAVTIHPNPSAKNRNRLQILWNEGNREWRTELVAGSDLGYSSRAVFAADFDGDGWEDLIWHSTPTTVGYFPNDHGSFPHQRHFKVGLTNDELQPIDIDGEGPLELAIPLADDFIAIYSLADWEPRLLYRIPFSPLDSFGPFSTGDFNLDGHEDLIVTQEAAEDIYLLLNDGSGKLEIHQRIPFSKIYANLDDSIPRLHLNALISRDMDGDLYPDLLIFHLNGSEIAWNRGDGYLDEPQYIENWGVWFAEANDMDGDGLADLVLSEWSNRNVLIALNRTLPARSVDENLDGVPDECDLPPRPRFIRGDVDDGGSVALNDAIVVLSYLFSDASAPHCLSAADANDDRRVNLADGVAILNMLFRGEGPLPPPSGECGTDRTQDALTCEESACPAGE